MPSAHLRALSMVVLCGLVTGACSSGPESKTNDGSADVVEPAEAALAAPEAQGVEAGAPAEAAVAAPEVQGVEAGALDASVDAFALDTARDVSGDRPAELPLLISPATPQTFFVWNAPRSDPITFRVGNAGDTAVGPLTVQISGPDAASFIITTTDCLALAPRGNCSVTVVFAPQSMGCVDPSATLVVTGPGPDFSTVSVPLLGRFLHESGWLLPTGGDLGSVGVGSVGAPTTFTLTIHGSACPPYAAGPFTVVLSSTEFVITDETCSTSVLTTGESCTVSVALRPTSPGAKSTTLIVRTADEVIVVRTADEVIVGKTLTGTGILADASIADAPHGAPDAASVDASAGGEARREAGP